jgi:hypothetical protein
LKRKWIRRVDPTNQRTTGPLMRKNEEEVVADITNTPKIIPIGEHTVAQVHPLSRNMGSMGWMS